MSRKHYMDMAGRTMVRSAAIVAVLLATAACIGNLRTDRTIAAERANRYVAAHPELSAQAVEDIRNLHARTGMTIEQVVAAWGPPAAIKRYRGGALQHWFFGCDWPHHCDYPDEESHFFPEPEDIYNSQVLFENGVASHVRY